MDAIRIRDEELFLDIKAQAAREGYVRMEDYVRMIHENRKIYQQQRKHKK